MEVQVSRILWIDVSSYEDNVASGRLIDFNMAKANGVRAVSFRANQGTAIDSAFKLLWAACKGILPRQAYMLLDCRYDWKPQVQCLLDLTKDDQGEIPDCFDFEPPFAMPDSQYWKYGFSGWQPLYNSLEMHKTAKPGIIPWIYTNWGFWNLAGPGNGTPQDAYFAQYPLWVAEYPNNVIMPPDQTQPQPLPHAWTNWLLWQFTQSGAPGDAQKFGINPLDAHSVDESVFNGSEDDFQKLTGGLSPVTPPPPVSSPSPLNRHIHLEKTITVDIDTLDPNTGVVIKML
jgi:GH25 family lysozyme M1 (1,4-beta-N-acetylmuramidase)